MATIKQEDLTHFYGTTAYYKHWTPHLVFTDGVRYLAENGAMWLVDAIASYQPQLSGNQRLQEFQLWNLKLDGNGGAVLTCQEDSNQPNIVKQEIEYTDFPFAIKLYVEPGSFAGKPVRVLLLPSEH